MFSTTLAILSLALVSQTHTIGNNELRVRVTYGHNGPGVSGATVELSDFSGRTVVDTSRPTDSQGYAVVRLGNDRLKLRAVGPDGSSSPYVHVPDYNTITLELPVEVAARPRTQEGACTDDCCAVCRPVWRTCVCNGIQYRVCNTICEARCTYVDCGCCCDCDCGCYSVGSSCVSGSRSVSVGPGVAQLNMSVPAQAVVFINGRKTASQGANRSYLSQGLRNDATYRYVVSVQVARGGRVIEDTRELTLRANENKSVSFDFSDIGNSEYAAVH